MVHASEQNNLTKTVTCVWSDTEWKKRAYHNESCTIRPLNWTIQLEFILRFYERLQLNLELRCSHHNCSPFDFEQSMFWNRVTDSNQPAIGCFIIIWPKIEIYQLRASIQKSVFHRGVVLKADFYSTRINKTNWRNNIFYFIWFFFSKKKIK